MAHMVKHLSRLPDARHASDCLQLAIRELPRLHRDSDHDGNLADLQSAGT